MRVVFAGSPEFAATILASLLDTRFHPVAVYTQPDRPQGRGRQLQPNPVKSLASSHDIPVLQPASLKDDAAATQLAALEPDVLVVVAYGLILPSTILQLPIHGCINVHASLLPRWRGAAPIEHAFMAGDPETGICIMQMDEGLDTGPVFSRRNTPIDDTTTIEDLTQTLCNEGASALLDVLTQIADGHAPEPVAQATEGVTYAAKLKAPDRLLDWTRTADQLTRQINALASRMPVRCKLGERAVQLIEARVVARSGPAATVDAIGTITNASDAGIEVQCVTDRLQITRLKLEGKGVATPKELINGYPELFAVGNKLQ